MKKAIPNIITTARLILALIFPVVFFYKFTDIAIIIFILASISDFLDGYLARKWNVVSTYGKNLDPVADKLLMVFSVLLIILLNENSMIITLIFEMIIVIINILLFSKTKVFNVLQWGKIKTVFLFLLIIAGLSINYHQIIEYIFYFLLIITSILQIISIFKYFKDYKRLK